VEYQTVSTIKIADFSKFMQSSWKRRLQEVAEAINREKEVAAVGRVGVWRYTSSFRATS